MKSREPQYPYSKRLWSKEEDQLLIRIVGKQTSPKWTFISQQFNEITQKNPSSKHIFRTNKQCRERWQNHLNPQLKNHVSWSENQHKALFQLFKHNSHQWCELASKLQSQGFSRRGENNIKNYFYTAIKRQIKRMNEIIKQNNKLTKRKKSQINKYRSKYCYNPRLSLQREILVKIQPQLPKILVQGELIPSTSSLNNQNPQHYNSHLSLKDQNSMEIQFQKTYGDRCQLGNLHIIKQLDYELISKILLIAQEKGSKKYIISSNQTKQCHQTAQKLRNEFIELIMQKAEPLDKQRVRLLTIKMLKISRRCKRKINKVDDFQELYVEDSSNSAKKKGKAFQQSKVIDKPQKNLIQPQVTKFFKQEEQKSNGLLLDLGRSSQYSRDEQPCINSSIRSSLELAPSSSLFKNQIDNDYLFNSSFLQANHIPSSMFRNRSNQKVQNRSQNKQNFQFFKIFRAEQQNKVEQLPPRISTIRIADQSLLFYQLQEQVNQNRIIRNSVPTFSSSGLINNNQPQEQEPKSNFLTNSWLYSSQKLDKRSSVDRNMGEGGFVFPEYNFQ